MIVKDLKTLASELLQRRAERHVVSMEHLESGIRHAKVNAQVVALEEELIRRFPGAEVDITTTVKIGTPGCRLHDRIRIEV